MCRHNPALPRTKRVYPRLKINARDGMNIRQALAYGQGILAHSPTPAADSRLLLEHLLQANHSYLIAHDDHPLSPTQMADYQQLLAQAAQAVPIPYLIEQAPFRGLAFQVTPAVLIPRPETEQLVEAAKQWLADRPQGRVVDVGTGSGCIIVSLAREMPALTHLAGTDISPTALAIAQANAQRHHVAQRITFYQGDMLEPIPHLVELILANLPYIADDEWELVAESVKRYEPKVALQGGADGLDLIRDLLVQAKAKLTANGAIFLEIGWQQGKTVYQIATDLFPSAIIHIRSDDAGHDRLAQIVL